MDRLAVEFADQIRDRASEIVSGWRNVNFCGTFRRSGAANTRSIRQDPGIECLPAFRDVQTEQSLTAHTEGDSARVYGVAHPIEHCIDHRPKQPHRRHDSRHRDLISMGRWGE